jgi:hypothetical protein
MIGRIFALDRTPARSLHGFEIAGLTPILTDPGIDQAGRSEYINALRKGSQSNTKDNGNAQYVELGQLAVPVRSNDISVICLSLVHTCGRPTSEF